MPGPLDNKDNRAQTIFKDCQDILMGAPIGIFTSMPDGGYISANPALARMYGYDSPEELMKSVTDIAGQVYANPEDRKEFIRTIKKQGEVVNHESRRLRRDGTVFWVSMNSRAVQNEDGQIVAFQGFTTDITERKNAEVKTQEQSDLVVSLLDSIPDIIFIKDIHGVYLGCNSEFARHVGQRKEDIPGKTDYDLYPKEEADFFRENDRRMLELGKPRHNEEQISYPDGRNILLDTLKTPYCDADGNVLGVIAICRDITERKKVDEALRKSENLFRKVFEILPIGLWIADKDGKLLRGNPAGIDIWGAQPGVDQREYGVFKARRLPSGKEIAPDDWALAHTVNKGETIVDELLEIEAFDGKKKIILNYTAPILDSSGQMEGAIVVNQDVTDGKGAENALRESEERFKALHNASFGGITIHDKGIILECNQGLSQITGYDYDELVGMDGLLLIAEQSREMVMNNILAGYEKPYEAFGIRKNGEEYPLRLEARNIPYKEKMVRVVEFRDITEQKQAEEQIRAINEQLKKANAEKDTLFAIIAHDLKSPMASVYSTSEILAKEAESLPLADIRHISAEMHKNSQNVLELVNDLMQWAHMSQGGMDFSPEGYSIDELVNSNLDTAQDLADKKDITIHSDIPDGLTVMVDQAMIKTVIRNVIFNAIKFTHRGGNVSLTARNAGSFIEVCARDNGIGMSETMQSTVFSVDKCKRQLGTDGEKGTGLGLILCKEFVEKHGGQIWLESEQGKGTKVFFTLPYGQDSR